MSETIVIKGVTGVRWGVDSVAVVTGSYTQSTTIAREPGINKRVRDEKGFVVNKIFGDDIYKLTMKAVYKGATPPATGDFMTVVLDSAGSTTSNTNFVCEKCTWEYGNENTLLLTIEAEATSQITSS